MVFFQKVQNAKICRSYSVKYRIFTESPTSIDLSPLCNFKKWEAAIYCPEIVSIHVENREISGPCSFWTPVKSNISYVWNWNCWPLSLVWFEIWSGGAMPPWPPNGYAPGLLEKSLGQIITLALKVNWIYLFEEWKNQDYWSIFNKSD